MEITNIQVQPNVTSPVLEQLLMETINRAIKEVGTKLSQLMLELQQQPR